jgi:hypothetical protein
MTLNDSLNLISTFYKKDILLGKSGDTDKALSLEMEKGIALPSELKDYIDNVAPLSGLYFDSVGNPIEIYSRTRLSWVMDGYNFNPVTKEPIHSWNGSWFIIADEGADPVIVNLDEKTNHSSVYKAMHGAGAWDFHPIADSIGQFLVCSAAIDHALNGFDLEEVIIDDENGFNLANQPAEWLFPFIQRYAPKYYDEWVSVFDNG